MRYFWLESNKLRYLANGIFEQMPYLWRLTLRRSQITYAEAGVFDVMTSLTVSRTNPHISTVTIHMCCIAAVNICRFLGGFRNSRFRTTG